jgi:hypothetical protein
MEISEIRRRLKQTIEQTRRAAAERRERTDAAAKAYEIFLERIAAPVFKQFAAALRAEGHPFHVFTPGGGLRLASERSAEDFVEWLLDVSGEEPAVLVRVSSRRGSRVLSHEAPLGSEPGIARLTEGDVLELLLREIPPLIAR